MKALTLAGHIVRKCLDEKREITNLQLQKILYLLQLQSYKKSSLLSVSKGILEPNQFEAWMFGPVVRQVYEEYCLNAAMPIMYLGKSADSQKIEPVPDYVDPLVEALLDLKPWRLVKWTHRADGAWKQVYDEDFKKIIPEDLLIGDSKEFSLEAVANV